MRFIIFFLLLINHLSSLAPAESLELLRNGSFEEDEMSYKGENPASCGGASSDQWINQQDGFPDGWTWPGVFYPHTTGRIINITWPNPQVHLDRSVVHSGKQSLKLSGKHITIRQVLPWNRLRDIYKDLRKSGKIPKQSYRKHGSDYTSTLLFREGLQQPVELSAWVSAKDIPAEATATIHLKGGIKSSLELDRGSFGWKKVSLTLKPQKGKLIQNLEVLVEYRSPKGIGSLWVDSMSLSIAERKEPNLLPNASFESVASGAQALKATGRGTSVPGAANVDEVKDYPQGWSRPTKWSYVPPPSYYIWNHWGHFFSAGRGKPKVDRLVARSGRSSLRFDLLPGDDYFIDSPKITLNQKEKRPIEVTAWIRADRLRQLDFSLVDEKGRRVPTNPTLEYWGGLWSGTHDWIAVRKIFSGFEAIASARLRIAGRGFNGQTQPDIGVWHAFDQVSTVWIDDLRVREIYSSKDELKARGVPTFETKTASNIHISRLDLGERLYGPNRIKATLVNPVPKPCKIELCLKQKGRTKKVTVSRTLAGNSRLDIEIPYRIDKLSQSWKDDKGAFELSLKQDDVLMASETYHHGTWPVIANVRPSKAYLDEDENPMAVSINLGLSREAIDDISHLKLELVHRVKGNVFSSRVIKDLKNLMTQTSIPAADKDPFYFYMPRAGLLDHRNLIIVQQDISKLPLHPWDNPEADYVVKVSGYRGEKKVFSSSSHPFGRLTRMREKLEPIREVTVDPKEHFLRVNGKPFFVLGQSHSNGPGRYGSFTRGVSFDSDRIKLNGLNSMQRWSGKDVLQRNWEKGGVYGPMLMSGYGAHYLGIDTLHRAHEKLKEGQVLLSKRWRITRKENFEKLDEVNTHPSALCYVLAMDECLYETKTSEEMKLEEEKYIKALKPKINRPMGIMDNQSHFYPWNVDSELLNACDVFYYEREPGFVSRPWLTMRSLLERKERWAIIDLPQTYENVPHAQERYTALRYFMHGARGWFGIQGCADPSLYRGLGGELRHIFKYVSSGQGRVQVKAPAGLEVKAWRKDDRVLVMAERHNPVPRGEWTWARGVGGYAGRAHTGHSSHRVTPIKAGFSIHGYNEDIYRELQTGDRIQQGVYIPKDADMEAVFLIIPGDGGFNQVAYWGKFDHDEFRKKKVDEFLTGECYNLSTHGLNYRHRHKAAPDFFKRYRDRYRFPRIGLRQDGELPTKGRWQSLEVNIERFALQGKVMDGLMFMSRGHGKVWWSTSKLLRKKGETVTLLEDRLGRKVEEYRETPFQIEGIDQAHVRVLGESRSLNLVKGRWSDDMRGENLFGNLRNAHLGDGITYSEPVDKIPEFLNLGYSIDDAKRCIRVYEIIPKSLARK